MKIFASISLDDEHDEHHEYEAESLDALKAHIRSQFRSPVTVCLEFDLPAEPAPAALSDHPI